MNPAQFLQKLSTLHVHRFPLNELPNALQRLDLSVQRTTATLQLEDQACLAAFVEAERKRLKADVLWGGYLEQRRIYDQSAHFAALENRRDIHLGIDFWTKEGAEVVAALGGTIHSFQNNPGFRDYGPTIILQHEFDGQTFHSLYGHLHLADLTRLEVGMHVKAGEKIGHIGNAEENGQWPPHLHFQLIFDMQEKNFVPCLDASTKEPSL